MNTGVIIMTLKEAAARFGVSETSLTGAFPRTQKSILKKWGVHLIKKGRGLGATYEVQEDKADSRALTLFDEVKDNISFDEDSIKLMTWPFLVFLTIVSTPMLVFRGSYEDFLDYVQISATEENLAELMPITSPFILSSAPPELPGLIAASVCIIIASVVSMLRPSAETMPVVTDCP